MAHKVVFPFRHQDSLICRQAKDMLLEAGFELICNDTGHTLSRQEQKEMIADAFAVVAGTESYDADMLSVCRNLKTIIRFGVGTDNFDLKAMADMGISAGRIANHDAVAEFALTLMLAALKNLPLYDRTVRGGDWQRYPMRELTQKTVGLLGFGKIGQRLAELLGGFHVTILACDPFMNPAAAKRLQVTPVSFHQLLARSDILSLHLPATADTYHIIDQNALAEMKDGAFLINTSRGSLVCESALEEALKSGRLTAAGLDVFEKEPVKGDNPFLCLSNTVLAPHVSALTFETNYNGSLICARSIIQVMKGGEPCYPVGRTKTGN